MTTVTTGTRTVAAAIGIGIGTAKLPDTGGSTSAGSIGATAIGAMTGSC